jgi:hypothetical protein
LGFEDDLQSGKDRFIVIHEQESYGCQGVNPLCRLHTDQCRPWWVAGQEEYQRSNTILVKLNGRLHRRRRTSPEKVV